MALEERLAALTDEIQKLHTVTAQLLAVRTEAIDSVKSAAAPAKKAEKAVAEPAKESAKETEKPAATAAAPEPTKMSVEDMQAAVDAGSPPSVDLLKAAVASYVDFGGTEADPVSAEERAARMGKIKDLLANPKVAAKKVAEVPENARKAVLKKVISFIGEIGATAEVDDL